MQEISLNFHVKCEQWVHFVSGSFFNFNGTAGVWRRRTIMDVGGWNARTTVEDMDLSLRAFLHVGRALLAHNRANADVLGVLPSSDRAGRRSS